MNTNHLQAYKLKNSFLVKFDYFHNFLHFQRNSTKQGKRDQNTSTKHIHYSHVITVA